jgi:hypothetical protein
MSLSPALRGSADRDSLVKLASWRAALWASILLFGSSCGAGARDPIAPPPTGVFFGAKTGYYQSEVSSFESLIGREIAIRAIGVEWDGIWPDARVVEDHAQGRLVLITWRGTDLGRILSGQFDDMIRARAREVRQLGFPIFLRPMHEMNGSWFPWCCDPTKYREAWTHIQAIFADEDAANVAWVWSPTASDGGWDAYYPGDHQVDWIGASVYNWGSAGPAGRWRSLAETLGPFYARFESTGKPLMLAEVGSAEQGGDKAAWLRAASAALEERFPAVKAWIHQQYEDGEADWRIESSQESLEAYRRLASSPYFAARPPARAESVTGAESPSNE